MRIQHLAHLRVSEMGEPTTLACPCEPRTRTILFVVVYASSKWVSGGILGSSFQPCKLYSSEASIILEGVPWRSM
eukprot:scaffold210149_cov33-Tisochrysis_lutea.AAC.2